MGLKKKPPILGRSDDTKSIKNELKSLSIWFSWFDKWLHHDRLPGYKAEEHVNWSLTYAPISTVGSISTPFTKVHTVTSDYTLTDEYDLIYVDCSSGDVTITLPQVSDLYDSSNEECRNVSIMKIGTDTNKIIINGTVNGDSDTEIEDMHVCLTISNNGTNYYIT